MDCDSEEAFDVSLDRLYQRWELSPGFHKWFLKTQADVFRCHMIKPVHEHAQLGSPLVKFTESSNSVVKYWTGFKKKSSPEATEAC